MKRDEGSRKDDAEKFHEGCHRCWRGYCRCGHAGRDGGIKTYPWVRKEEMGPGSGWVVIVGSGAAGLSAAVEASGSKAKVIVLEKLPDIGGTSRMSFGNFGTLNSPEQRRRARRKPPLVCQRLHEYFIKEKLLLGGYLNDAALVRIFVEQSLDAYNWLTSLGFA